MNGKVFCPYDKGEENYGLLMMGLESDKFHENAELLASISNDFIIKEYHLGTEPYVYVNGYLNSKEVSRSLVLKDQLKDSDGNYRRESIVIGCYRSEEQKEWILSHKQYNVRFNEGRAGAVYNQTQQVFTASFLILYDYRNQEADADCYMLDGKTLLVNGNGMQSMEYPKTDWVGNEEYLLYHIGDKLCGTLQVKDILEKHPEVHDGKPLYLYFQEVESFEV